MTEVITRFGVFGVFLLMVPESACIPVPSEVTLLFSGFAVSQHWMSFRLAVLAATAGNVVGSLIAYGLGASGLINRIPVARKLEERSEHLLGDRELRAVFLARLLPLARTFVSLPAGARRVPLAPFTMLTALGCAIWAFGFIVAGALAGTAWHEVSGIAGKASLAIAGGVLALAALRRVRR
jgi:membrane protein DedA with SNARE-associated domain